MLKRSFSFCFAVLLSLIVLPQAKLFSAQQTAARDMTAQCTITLGGASVDARLVDNDEKTYVKYTGAEIAVTASEPIGGVYIKFDKTPPDWLLREKDGAAILECGRHGFLHEYQKLEGELSSIVMSFRGSVSIADIFILSKGDKLPDFVQAWTPAEGECDIMLLSCHSDDDQLFFAGSVPDAVARGAVMQVCFFTNHWNTHDRPHELLNGLWTCGLRRYPVIGPFTDTRKGMSEEEGLRIFAELGFSYDNMVAHQVELLRRFKPRIVLAHDIDGEYGHSAHRLDSHSLRDAALVSSDAEKYKDSAERYGVWDVPKIYIHLYGENKIDFEIDTPLEYFGGKTAYQMSQDAFRCHISQLGTRYRNWLLGTDEKPVTKASEFPDYSPRYYGLWRSLVGDDVIKTDFYENITLLSQQGGAAPTAEPTSEAPEAESSISPTETQSASPVQPTGSEAPLSTAEPIESTGSGRSTALIVAAVLLGLCLVAAGYVFIRYKQVYNWRRSRRSSMSDRSSRRR